MKTFMLILSIIKGDPETGPVYSFVLAEGLTLEQCEADVADSSEVWLGDDSIGMFCEEEQ